MISHLITELSCDPDVQKVSINSTLNKRYIRDEDHCKGRETDDGEKSRVHDGIEVKPDDVLILTKSAESLAFIKKNGKALIICNQHDDSQYGKYRKEALKNASTIFDKYFNFEVSSFENCFPVVLECYSLNRQTEIAFC